MKTDIVEAMYRALGAEAGVEISVENVDDIARVKSRFYAARNSDPAFIGLTLQTMPFSANRMAIIKKELLDDFRKPSEGDA